MKAFSNHNLEQAARSGDAAAFGQLIRQYDQQLRGVAWSVVRNPHALDDVMQDTYERAFTAIKTFRGDAAIGTWLHSVCYRTALSYVRRESYRNHSNLESVDELPAPHSTSDIVLTKAEFESAMTDLEPEKRALLILTQALGYSYNEAAEITGLERGTVASKVSRLKQRIRQNRKGQ